MGSRVGKIKYHVIHHPTGDKSLTLADHKKPSKHGGYYYPYDVYVNWDGKVEYGTPLTQEGNHCIADYEPYKTMRMNSCSIGYAVAGDFTKYPPSEAQLISLSKEVAKDIIKHGTSILDVIPHRKVSNTACCGNMFIKNWANFIVMVKKELATLQGAPVGKPVPKTKPKAPVKIIPKFTLKLPTGTLIKGTFDSAGVKILQKALAHLGIYEGATDGDFGSKTEDALEALQRAGKLKADGIYGKNTREYLEKRLGVK